jgi:hypothetical protein
MSAREEEDRFQCLNDACFHLIMTCLLGNSSLEEWIYKSPTRENLRLVNRSWNTSLVQLVKKIRVSDQTLNRKHEENQMAYMNRNCETVTEIRSPHCSPMSSPIIIPRKISPLIHRKREALEFHSEFTNLETIILGVKQIAQLSKAVCIEKLFRRTFECRMKEFEGCADMHHLRSRDRSIRLIVDVDPSYLIDQRPQISFAQRLFSKPVFPVVHIVCAYTEHIPASVDFSCIDLSHGSIHERVVIEMLKEKPTIRQLNLQGNMSITMEDLFPFLLGLEPSAKSPGPESPRRHVLSTSNKTPLVVTLAAESEGGNGSKEVFVPESESTMPSPRQFDKISIAGCTNVSDHTILRYFEGLKSIKKVYPAYKPPVIDIFCSEITVNEIVEIYFGSTIFMPCRVVAVRDKFVVMNGAHGKREEDDVLYRHRIYDVVLLPAHFFKVHRKGSFADREQTINCVRGQYLRRPDSPYQIKDFFLKLFEGKWVSRPGEPTLSGGTHAVGPTGNRLRDDTGRPLQNNTQLYATSYDDFMAQSQVAGLNMYRFGNLFTHVH